MGEGWHRGSGSVGRRVPWRPLGTGSAQWGSGLAPGALGVLAVHPGAVSCTHRGVPGDKIEECHLLNGTEKVRFVERFIYNREQFLIFDSDVGVYVGFIAYGKMNAKRSNRHPVHMEYYRALVDTQCWRNYELYAPFTTVERRGERGAERVPSDPALPMTLELLKFPVSLESGNRLRGRSPPCVHHWDILSHPVTPPRGSSSPSQSIPVTPSAPRRVHLGRAAPSVSILLVPSSSQPSPGRLLCWVVDFYPAHIQARWFQGQQELSDHMVATDMVPQQGLDYQLLELLETPTPRAGSPTPARWSTSAWSTP
ncbi:rano class II histocompatibility antigen, D-1 beta chain-like [Haemorhous mexicanus]|uniref:rano class II histocompatibility antigen, D-1 beta chain-like n=1 Tax=Haemorhous mexicanus TaxID=30427 RepID=UPI0028BD5E62|nr:rano class II histocompatibility antigen, D-1 beta chain-like [Haemorhous mexicanus]